MLNVLLRAFGFLLMIASAMLAFTLIGTLILVAALEPFFSSNFSSVVASNAQGGVSINFGLIVALGGGTLLLYCVGLFLFINSKPAKPAEAASGDDEP